MFLDQRCLLVLSICVQFEVFRITLKMDVQSDYTEPVTPGLSYDGANYWKAEDSGYHSFTPGSLEYSEISSDSAKIAPRKICITGQIHMDCRSLTPDINYRSHSKYTKPASILKSCENIVESPVLRRGLKRSFQEDDSENVFSPFPTPTSVIAGSLRELKFNDSNKISTSFTFGNVGCMEASDLYYHNDHIHTSYPTTPIKKICSKSCKLSSPLNLRKPSKKLNFVMHSLSCDTQALQPVVQPVKFDSLTVQPSKFRPDQKIDIIKLLYHDENAMPPIIKILSYLSNKDKYNFGLVSPLWLQVWEDVSKIKSIQVEYMKFLKDRKENQENKNTISKSKESNQLRPLVEIHNLIDNPPQRKTPSPPGTPRTIKFKKYAKSASLDVRMQLSCVRCVQPAKVTEDPSGEEWAECTSVTCSYQFCRYCKCDRHPGKSCFQYDLNGPSPSKRKKTSCVVGTKKSRRNLRRLL